VTRSGPSCPQFGMEFAYDVGTVSIFLHGELDALSVPVFGGVLRALADRGARSVMIDLSELRFCNVGGLRVMADLAAHLNAADGRVEIRAPAILARMLAISDLHSLFLIVDSGTATMTNQPPTAVPHERPLNRARAGRPRACSRHCLSAGP
jgi:anti-anti-sigma factor